MLTCSIRPSGIWGRGDQTMFRKVFESVLAGHVKVLVGSKHVKLDNSYVHNLIHGFILAGEHLVPGGTAPGQAYFINDGEPINMFEFSRPVVEACGQRWPKLRVSGALVRWIMTIWQWLHFRVGLPKPLLEPLAVERLYLDNYFSIAKAERDLGYRPLFTTAQAMRDCLPLLPRALRADEGGYARSAGEGGHGAEPGGLITSTDQVDRVTRYRLDPRARAVQQIRAQRRSALGPPRSPRRSSAG